MKEKHSLGVIILDLSSVSKLVLIFCVDLKKIIGILANILFIAFVVWFGFVLAAVIAVAEEACP